MNGVIHETLNLFDAPAVTSTCDLPAMTERAAVMPIVDMATLRAYKKRFNFFETPSAIADKMADLLGLGRGARILEPSAGLGALIRAVEKALPFEKTIDYCEVQDEFIPFLAKYNRVGTDFMGYRPDPIYDAVIMNPPYSKKLAELHVDHAWECVKPGGRIIALVGKQAAAYIDDEYMGHVFHREEIKKGFAETSIDTYLYLIHKPLY